MTTWSNTQKNIGQTSISYNETGKTYNEPAYSYWGIIVTVFSNLSKTVTSFTNLSRTTNTLFTNQNKN